MAKFKINIEISWALRRKIDPYRFGLIVFWLTFFLDVWLRSRFSHELADIRRRTADDGHSADRFYDVSGCNRKVFKLRRRCSSLDALPLFRGPPKCER